MSFIRVVVAAALSVAVVSSAAANSITVVNALTDTGIRILAYNQNDLVQLVYCAQVDIAGASSSTQINSASASDCMRYPGLSLQIRTFKDNYPYGSMGTSCSVANVPWNGTVTVSFGGEYKINCNR